MHAQDLAKLAEAKEKRIEEARQKEELAKKRELAKKQKTLAEAEALTSAKEVLQRHNGDRTLCDRQLCCNDLVLLLKDMGFNDEAHSRDGKRLLQADLRTLFWHKYNAQHSNPVTVIQHTDASQRNTETSTDEDSDDGDDSEEKSIPFQIGDKVRVWWPSMRKWYSGVVDNVDEEDDTMYIHYPESNEHQWHDMTWKCELLK